MLNFWYTQKYIIRTLMSSSFLRKKRQYKNHGYNGNINIKGLECIMPKKTNGNLNNFGSRLAKLRKAAGYTQLELANEISISRRMIAYYEKQTKHLPTNLMPDLARALGVSTDELLGINAPKDNGKKLSLRLLRRVKRIEALPQSQQKTLLRTIDTFLKGAEK